MKPLLLIIFLSTLPHTVHATDQPMQPARTKPLKAEYTIYSGELGNEQAPSKSDRKLAIEINGPAAKDIFDSLYPDAKVTCSGEQGERLRSKGNLWCSFLPTTGYRCFLGYDLSRQGHSWRKLLNQLFSLNIRRLRSKRDVWCSFQPPSQYRCFLGFDLRTGNSIAGASC